jgi:cytochrome P450
LDALLPRGRFDLTQDYGGIIASSVICGLMGMPGSMAAEVLRLVNSLTVTDPEAGGVDTANIMDVVVQSLLPWVQKRRAAGADGSLPVIDGMIQYRVRGSGRALRDEEVALQLLGIFIGGVETVPKVTAHGLMELYQRPDQLDEVRRDLETNVPKAAEEMIRYCAPAQWFMRTVHKQVTVAGQILMPGQRVLALYGAAGRDEREYEKPDEFIWNRKIKRLLAFGAGQHHCTGVHLARLEVRLLVAEFLRRVTTARFDMANAVRYPSSFQWGWNCLPVIIEQYE